MGAEHAICFKQNLTFPGRLTGYHIKEMPSSPGITAPAWLRLRLCGPDGTCCTTGQMTNTSGANQFTGFAIAPPDPCADLVMDKYESLTVGAQSVAIEYSGPAGVGLELFGLQFESRTVLNCYSASGQIDLTVLTDDFICIFALQFP